jgi:hypothetical protein
LRCSTSRKAPSRAVLRGLVWRGAAQTPVVPAARRCWGTCSALRELQGWVASPPPRECFSLRRSRCC